MTVLQFAENLVDERWTVSIDGRPNDVPKPKIILEGEQKRQRTSIDERDEIVVEDGGTQEFTPKGIGWTEEDVTFVVTFDLRTADSRERFFGYRQETSSDPLGSGERYGGLAGEMKRILDTARKGEKEYDLVTAYQFNDLTSETGGSVWRGQYTVRFEVRSTTINPDPQP